VKGAVLALCLFIVLSTPILFLSQSDFALANAEAAIPKPSVPEFSVALVDTSYDVPTTYSTDPYTGKQVAHGGYHVARRALEVRIKNQPFTPFTDSDGHEIKFYYNIRIKGHYEEWGSEFDPVYNHGEMPTQLNSDYTVILYNSSSISSYSFGLTPAPMYMEVSPNGQLDFQVKALVGYTYEKETYPAFLSSFFEGEESDWSATQTITIPPSGSSSSSTSPSQTTEPTPEETQQPLQLDFKIELFPTVPVEVAAIATVIMVVVVCAGLLVYFKKRKQEARHA